MLQIITFTVREKPTIYIGPTKKETDREAEVTDVETSEEKGRGNQGRILCNM
jgi:predicted secreted protein